MSLKRKRGRPRGPVPRVGVSLRLSQRAVDYYKALAEKRTAEDADRGREVGYTEVMRELLEQTAREGGAGE